MSVPTNLIPTKITGLPEYTGTSQAGYFPYVLDGTTYKVQFSSVASAGEVPPSRTLTAGTGLVGGGDLSANRVFAIANGGVGAQQLDTTGVVAGVYGNASNIPTVTVDANGRVTSVTTSPVVATGYVPESRTITAGTGLIGGGSLANNITLSLNLSSATPQALGTATAGVSTAAARGDHVHPAVNLSDTNETQGALPLGRGGTGDALSPVAGAVVYSTGTKLAMTNPGAVGQVLVSTGADEPVWSFVGSGTVTSVNASGGSTGMTFTGGPITTSGTLTLGGTLATGSGGTGLTGTPTNGQLLIGNGTGYALSTLTAGTAVSITNAAGSITIDNTAPDQIVSLTAGTAISVTGTYPNFTIGNTAPDQIVSLTGAGTTTISGTYPNFTITSNDQFTGTVTSVAASGGTTGLTFSGSPITTAGTLTLGGTLAVANGGTGATTASGARANLGAAASGANSDITSLSGITGGISTADFVAFDTTNVTPPTTGQIAWSVDDGTLDVGLNGGATLKVGQQTLFYAKNTSGGTIPIGTPVMFTGVVGASGKLTFGLAVANGSVPPEYMMGVTTQNVVNNAFGYIASFGLVRGFNTSGAPYGETWADGDLLYFSPVTPGGWTKVEPQAPNIHVPVAVVVNAATGGSGSIFVRMLQSERLGELQDVEINGGGPAAGQVLIYDPSQSRWENNTLTAGSNITITNGNGSITIAATEQFTGTVTSVAASGGTTGLTFSGSPITSAGTLTLGGTLAIGSGGTGATTAGGARTALGAAASGANTDITSIALTSGTILNAPTSGTDIVNKAYADSIAAGINFHQSVRLATVAPLPANTYNNGSSGVGATLTANANGALSIDGVAVVAGNRVLVKNEAAQANNGVYVVTQTGSGSTPYILTRATDFNTAGSGVNQIDAGDFFFVTAGNTLANTSWVQQTPLPITVGTTPIIFSQFGAPVLYSAGTGLSLAGTVFSIANTGVSASTYGSASQVPVLAVNAQGQITSASNTSISIAASQVTSGSLAVARGGTGLGTTPTNGQLLIGNGTGYSLSTLSAGTGISVSNASGSVTVTNTAPDQIVTITGGGATVVTGTYPNFTVSTTTGTGTVTSVDVSGGTTGLSFTGGPITSSGIITMGGTLGVANGGTGVTTSTGTGSVVLNTSPTLVTPTLGAASATSIANGLGAVGTPSYTFTGDLNTGMWSPAADTIAFSEGGVEVMRLDASGNVGIGTSAPGVALDVAGDAVRVTRAVSPAAFLGRQGNGTLASPTATVSGNQIVALAGSGHNGSAYTATPSAAMRYLALENFTATANGAAITFETTPIGSSTAARAERMRIDGSGNVGIGTTAPSALLNVYSATGAFIDLFGDAGTTISAVRSSTDATGANMVLRKARGTTASRTAVASGDTMGTLFFSAFGGTNNRNIASIVGTVGTYTSDADISSNLIFNTTPTGSVSPTERMRIDSSGNVGIGTTAPSQKLQVAASTNQLSLTTGTNELIARASSTEAALYTFQAIPLVFYNNNTERMRIDSSGNVGIGTSAPSARLDVRSGAGTDNIIANRGGNASYFVLQGTSFPNFNALQSYDGSNNLNWAVGGSGTLNTLAFMVNGNIERARITAAGRFGVNTTNPLSFLGVGSATGQVGFNIGTSASPERGNLWYDTDGTGWKFNIGKFQSSTFTAQMTFQDNGNVGIGTSSPTERLDTGSGNTRTQALVISGDQHLLYSASSTELGIRIGTGGPFYGIGTTGSSNMRINNASGGDMLFAIAGTERARINNSGQFLVGTSSGGRTVCINAADNWIRQSNPSRSWLIGMGVSANYIIWDETGGGARFTVEASTGNWLGTNSIILGQGQNIDNRIEVGQGRTGNNFAYIDLIGDTTYTDYGLRLLRGNGGPNATSELNHRGTGPFSINVQDAGVLVFSTSNTERMRFEAAGNAAFSSLIVGRNTTGSNVNTNNDTGSFSVRGDGSNAASMSFHRTGAYAINMGLGTDNVFRIGGWSASSNCFQMDGSGNLTMLGNVTAYSDARLKKDVETISGALDLVSKMRGVRYTRIDTENRNVGVIAQEMLEVVPEVVQQGTGDDDTLSVAYGNLVGVLIEAIKELTARVAELEGK